MKSIDRISAAMGVIISALRLPDIGIRGLAGEKTGLFLQHKFPRVCPFLFSSTIYG
jgi:hypothetical protein